MTIDRMSLLWLFSRVQILKYNYYISVTHLYDESNIELAKVPMNDVVIESVIYDMNKNRCSAAYESEVYSIRGNADAMTSQISISSLNNQYSLYYNFYPPPFDFSHSYQSLVYWEFVMLLLKKMFLLIWMILKSSTLVLGAWGISLSVYLILSQTRQYLHNQSYFED